MKKLTSIELYKGSEVIKIYSSTGALKKTMGKTKARIALLNWEYIMKYANTKTIEQVPNICGKTFHTSKHGTTIKMTLCHKDVFLEIGYLEAKAMIKCFNEIKDFVGIYEGTQNNYFRNYEN